MGLNVVVLKHVPTQAQELTITRAMMLGAVFVYDDYGHPERAEARKYWKCIGCRPGIYSPITGFGHTQAAAAWDWLRRTGQLELFKH